VADLDVDPVVEVRNLIAAATRRRLSRHSATGAVDELRAMRDARLALERIDDPEGADAAAEELLGWLQGVHEESE
jgi:hypothetical protein